MRRRLFIRKKPVEDVVQTPAQKYTWVKYILSRIKKNKNFIAIFTGPTGVGKSWTAISIAEMLDPNFSIERIVFKGSELMKLLNNKNLKSGSVIVWDEAGIDLSSRSWQSTTNKMLNFLMQTFRHRNIILLFTTPYMSFLDKSTRRLIHAQFEVCSIDYETKQANVKAKYLQYNGDLDKTYRKYLRFLKDGRITKLVNWKVPAPSKELTDTYELEKLRFTSNLNTMIKSELSSIEHKKNHRKKLTDRQQKIVDCWNKGITIQTKVAEAIGTKQAIVSNNIQSMKNKGYFVEDYEQIGGKP